MTIIIKVTLIIIYLLCFAHTQNSCGTCTCNSLLPCPVVVPYNESIIINSTAICNNNCRVKIELGANVTELFFGFIALLSQINLLPIPTSLYIPISNMPTNSVNINYFNLKFGQYNLGNESDYISAKVKCMTVLGCNLQYNLNITQLPSIG